MTYSMIWEILRIWKKVPDTNFETFLLIKSDHFTEFTFLEIFFFVFFLRVLKTVLPESWRPKTPHQNRKTPPKNTTLISFKNDPPTHFYCIFVNQFLKICNLDLKFFQIFFKNFSKMFQFFFQTFKIQINWKFSNLFQKMLTKVGISHVFIF